ncbi:hypothetical protein, partial [Roseinatronobacter thiooxidans]
NGSGGNGGDDNGSGGNGGDDNGSGAPYDISDIPAQGSSEFNELPTEGQALITEFLERNSGEHFDTSGLSGTATYSGAVGIAVDDAADGETASALLGDIGLTANFDNDSITGLLDSFIAFGDDAPEGGLTVDGSLSFSNGVITGSTFSATNLGGTLSAMDDSGTFTGVIEGTFLTDDAGQVIGILSGTVQDGEFIDGFEGIFSADRD